MSRRLPSFLEKTRICIICEGDEEYGYLDKLNKLSVWDAHYEVELINAEGNGNIPARYQDKYQNDSSDIVLVFCDTDKKPYEQYSDIKRKIDEFHGVDGAADQVVIFGNPCTMDIIVKHWADIDLKTQAKKINAPIIEEYTGVDNYKAKKNQIKQVMEYITADNYYSMKERTALRSSVDIEKNSSNFDRLVGWLEEPEDRWIRDINMLLDE